MKDRLYKATQGFSRAIIQPVLFMAVTGILISIMAVLKLDAMPEFFKKLGNYVFNILVNGNIAQLSVIFCVGLTTALAKKKKTDAAILGISVFLIFLYANNAWLELTGRLAEAGEFGLAGTGQNTVLGVQVIDMGVFLGIMLGLITAYVFNKYCDVKLPRMLSPYEGTRFVFLIMIVITIFLAIILTYIWPPINSAVTALVNFIGNTGPFGYFVYGFSNRMLLPLGLHHFLWMPLYYTPLGGTAEIAGEVYHGAMSIWYATLGNIDQITSIHPSIGYILNFGYTALPVGAALAFIRTAKPENKAKVKAVVWPAVFAAAFAGITEPIEFLFLFVAPVLWLAHALIYGFGLLLSSVLGLGVFVGPVIDTLMGALVVPVSLGKQWLIPIIFVILTAIEYFAFKALIVKLNLKTLGRDTVENGEGMEEVGGASSKRGSILSKESLGYIIEGLGGKDNILEINNCYTRLRIDVKDESLVNEAILKKSKNQGIIRKGSHIQIVIGMDVPEVKEELVAELARL